MGSQLATVPACAYGRGTESEIRIAAAASAAAGYDRVSGDLGAGLQCIFLCCAAGAGITTAPYSISTIPTASSFSTGSDHTLDTKSTQINGLHRGGYPNPETLGSLQNRSELCKNKS